jgi:NAD(P)-dependent dehydrogenase (short-subunit alcohol dehydrogenase family)
LNGRTAAIPGAGPGLGAAVARRFAREGFAADPASVGAAFGRVRRELVDPGVFVYNAGAFQMGGILEIDPGRFDECFKANCAGALCTRATNISSSWLGSGGPKR